jgi:hypothetical protein
MIQHAPQPFINYPLNQTLTDVNSGAAEIWSPPAVGMRKNQGSLNGGQMMGQVRLGVNLAGTGIGIFTGRLIHAVDGTGILATEAADRSRLAYAGGISIPIKGDPEHRYIYRITVAGNLLMFQFYAELRLGIRYEDQTSLDPSRAVASHVQFGPCLPLRHKTGTQGTHEQPAAYPIHTDLRIKDRDGIYTASVDATKPDPTELVLALILRSAPVLDSVDPSRTGFMINCDLTIERIDQADQNIILRTS